MSGKRGRLLGLCAAGLAVWLAGCGAGGELSRKDRGDKAYDSGDYMKAIEEYQLYLEQSTAGADAIDTQFMLAKSYFGNGDYPTAAVEFEIYQRDYPRSDSLLAAAYYEALCWVKQSPPYDRDSSDTERAIRELQNFLLDHPGNPYSDEANRWISEMRDKLAHKRLANARQYRRLGRGDAAVIYYELLLKNFPGSEYAEAGLLELMALHVERGDPAKAEALLRDLEAQMPGSELARRAREVLAGSG